VKIDRDSWFRHFLLVYDLKELFSVHSRKDYFIFMSWSQSFNDRTIRQCYFTIRIVVCFNTESHLVIFDTLLRQDKKETYANNNKSNRVLRRFDHERIYVQNVVKAERYE